MGSRTVWGVSDRIGLTGGTGEGLPDKSPRKRNKENSKRI